MRTQPGEQSGVAAEVSRGPGADHFRSRFLVVECPQARASVARLDVDAPGRVGAVDLAIPDCDLTGSHPSASFMANALRPIVEHARRVVIPRNHSGCMRLTTHPRHNG